MMIEIRKAGFLNKGAELMLLGILGEISRRMPGADLVMAPNLRSAPYGKRAPLGLYQKVWYQRYGIQWGHLGHLIPSMLRDLFGLVLDREIDVVLDASGFSYSDQVGLSSTLAMARAMRRWKRRDTKVILLPQAFGPFENGRIRASMRHIADNADLIFARDKISYKYLTDIAGKRESIRIAPDFTCLLPGTLPDRFDPGKNRFCIIPNFRMMEKSTEEKASAYISFLSLCARYLHEKGRYPFFLIHEGERDRKIADTVIKNTGLDIAVVIEEDPLKIKGILSLCEGVVGSRYHGLVSALSQGVPALAAGWSHKYEMLFADYSFPEGLIDIPATESEVTERIDRIIDGESRGELSAVLTERAEKQKELTGEMWDSVFSTIGNLHAG
jgi:colanic acid/amylovoran biosynthesis protein